MRYIIGHGWDSQVDVVDCSNIAAARAKAVEFSVAKGLSVEDANDDDVSWAVPYDQGTAVDLGLIWYEERGHPGDGWREAEVRR